jgi:prepilin-type N-terminal cleavage/methylation domain-containing protein
MTSRLRSRSGFTIVELLIVIVVIGILAGLVLNTFNGIQARARDTERKTDINAVHAQVEAYHADNAKYPTTTNLATAAWVDSNLSGLDDQALVDPSSGAYAYVAAPSGCDNTAGNECDSYTLSADLETDGRGGQDSDTNTADYSKDSLN